MGLIEETMILECAKSLGTTNFYGLCSGGKDSMTACYIAHQISPLTAIVSIDTTIGLPEALEAAKKLADLLELPHIILKPEFDYEQYVKKYGFPHPSQHSQVFIYLKWKPLWRFAKERVKEGQNICYISGVRKFESKRRFGNAKPLQYDKTYRRMLFAAPIIYWDTQRCIDFCHENSLPLSEAYKTIMMSGDCLCGAYAKKGEAEIICKFHPDTCKKLKYLESVAQKNHKGLHHWGNGSSISGASQQESVEDYICADCNTHRSNNE